MSQETSTQPPDETVDLLAPFREIASGCTEQECLEILQDCDDPRIRPIYERRLKQLGDRQMEVDYYEDKFSKQ